MYFDLPYDMPDNICEGDFLIATYLVSGIGRSEIIKKAGSFAIGQSIGTWLPLPGITKQMIEHYQARVIGLYPFPEFPGNEAFFILQVAFPSQNTSDSFAMMLTALVGNDVSTSLNLRLLDISMTPTALNHYKGPEQGVEGVRKLLGVTDRPLLLNMLKPSLGMHPDEAAALFYEIGMGGVDIVKDDEVLSSVPVSGVIDRVKAFTPVANRVYEETGNKMLYIPNVTSSPKHMRNDVLSAASEGCQAVMINFVETGLDALADLSEEFGDKMVIMGHYAGIDSMQSELSGISPAVVIGYLARLAGADMVMTMFAEKKDPSSYFNFIQTIQKQKMPLGRIKPILSTVGGGLSPLNVGKLIDEIGKDLVLGVGGAIQGHPMGAREGAKAVRAAMSSAVDGIPLDTAAQDCPALKKAIEIWGAKA